MKDQKHKNIEKACDSCKWYEEWLEPRPYGSTIACEILAGCKVGNARCMPCPDWRPK